MKSKILLSSLIYTLIGIIMLFQTNVVLAIASDPNNPITAAITSAIDIVNPTPTPTPTSIPVPTATDSATPTATASAEPVTSPITTDSTCLDFILFKLCFTNPISTPTTTPEPSSNPEATDSATLDATPSAVPVAEVVPSIDEIFPNPATQGTFVTLTGVGFTNSSEVYVGDALMPTEFNQVSEDGTSLRFLLPWDIKFVAGQTYQVFVEDDDLSGNVAELTIAPSVVLEIPPIKDNQLLVAPSVTLDADHPEVVLSSSNFNTNITIPSSVTNPILNFSDVLTITPDYAAAVYNNRIDLDTFTSIGEVKVQIPASSMITGPVNWDGKINAPKVLSNSTATPTVEAGKTNTVSAVVEIGAGDTPLKLEPVRILLPGQAGKLVGFQRGQNFTKITTNCPEDSQIAGASLGVFGAANECFISVGNDLVIWTNHFTKFVTYSQTNTPVAPASTNSGSSNSGGSSNFGGSSSSNSSNNNSPVAAPVCSDTKPASAPKLLSAKVTGRNEVTLSWSKAADPVTYYLVTYGTKSNKPEYGNPNIGGKDTTSYVVKGLNNNQIYYFKVRAGNNCMPGEFSNELSVKASGDTILTPANGFKPGVLSAQKASSKSEPKFKSISSANPQRVISGAENVISKIVSFFSHLFGKS